MLIFRTARLLSCLVLLHYLALLPGAAGLVEQHERITRVEPINDAKITILPPVSNGNAGSFLDKRFGWDHRLFTEDSITYPKHSDSFLLQFTAFDTSITLHLTPNFELFHSKAAMTVLHPDKDEDMTEPLLGKDHWIYKGHVVDADCNTPFLSENLNYNNPNWARIIIRHDIEHSLPSPLFEGAFSIHNDIHHIKTLHNFRLTKRHDDAPLNTTSPMVIYRDSDRELNPLHLLTRSSEFAIHANERQRHTNYKHDIVCAMEEMLYNRKLTGSFHTGRSEKPSWVDPTPSRTNRSKTTDTKEHSLAKRSGYLPGCPTARKVAYMGVAADCSYVQSYGSIRFARLQIINDWNIASAVFERTFNVALGLMYIQMSLPECPKHPRSKTMWNQGCSATYTINDRLSDFSLWRGQRGEDNAALWHLMTKCSTGTKLGIAWLGQLCEAQVSQQIGENGGSEWVSGTGVSSVSPNEWKTVAHEIAHGFGAIHDCTTQSCPCRHGHCSCCPLSDTICSAGDTYLMSPTSNVTTDDFSPCSISDVCGSLPNIGYCLQTPEQTNSKFAICGNGIIDAGEECDPGLTDSPCCYASTCRLKPGAVCDDYSQQCCINCAVAPRNTECRPSASECDIPEYCTGYSVNCPIDAYNKDGSPCANGTMQCASGVCTSRTEQCISRGMRLNIKKDCPFQKDTCQISCEDPADPSNCLLLSGVFLDGTECGLAGYCQKGKCVSTGAWNTLKAWSAQNKQIAIPVFLFGGLLILAGLGWLIWFLVIRYRRRRLGIKDKDSRPSSVTSTAMPPPLDDPVTRRKSVTLQADTAHHENTDVWELETMNNRQY